MREEFAWLRTMILGRSGTPTASAPTGAPPTGPARMNVAMLAPMHGPAVSQVRAPHTLCTCACMPLGDRLVMLGGTTLQKQRPQ